MATQDRAILEKLDAILRSAEVRAQIQPIVERVQTELAGERPEIRGPRSEVRMAWEPIPLSIYGDALPAMIRSSWVFILRAGTNTGAERHPNSHQRMMSFDGSGDMQVGKAKQTLNAQPAYAEGFGVAGAHLSRRSESEGGTPNAEVKSQHPEPSGKWQSNVLVSDPGAPLERRWISIPENVWHQPVVSKEADWVVVSFHTVPAEELIEERPIDHAASRTKQMRYVG
jgi:hypothetical protein